MKKDKQTSRKMSKGLEEAIHTHTYLYTQI